MKEMGKVEYRESSYSRRLQRNVKIQTKNKHVILTNKNCIIPLNFRYFFVHIVREKACDH